MQTNLLKPKAIHVEPIGHNRARVVLEPFERGYGHTLGNALRRVLLSSMVGYAVTEVTIAGVVHEYSTIDGVQEDVVNILLNLKGVVFKLHNRDEVTLSLRKEGEGKVTAADIQTPHDVEIINPEHLIANLSQGGKIDIQLLCTGFAREQWHIGFRENLLDAVLSCEVLLIDESVRTRDGKRIRNRHRTNLTVFRTQSGHNIAGWQ